MKYRHSIAGLLAAMVLFCTLFTPQVVVKAQTNDPVQPEETLLTVVLHSEVEGVPGASVATLTGGGVYGPDEVVTVCAPEVAGYRFVGWYAQGQEEPVSVESSSTFALTEDVELTAVYAANAKQPLRVYGTNYSVDGRRKLSDTLTEKPGGTQVVLEYTGDDEFLYWVDENGCVVSREEQYAFALVRPSSIVAVTYADAANAEAQFAAVEFLTEQDQILLLDTWYTSESGQTMPEYAQEDFVGWRMNSTLMCSVQDILDAIADGQRRITVQALLKTDIGGGWGENELPVIPIG